MGDAESSPIRLSFNPQLRVEFRGATVTSDAGLVLPRELDERLGVSMLLERHLGDPRTGRNCQFPLADLFRQSIYSRLAGYEDTNDAERLAEDPPFRMLASRERRATSVALTSTAHWFETAVLTEEQNYDGLTRLNADLIQCVAVRSHSRRVTLDIDSSESPIHGTQEQSAYNGHFESVCYHPLFVFNPEGDCLAAKLRPGNVHSAEGWDEVLLPLIDRYRRRRQRVVVRADAAFAMPALYEALERRGVRYAIRLPANDVLERQIEDLLTRPRGRPSRAPLVRYRSFHYQAASWDRPRRVIAKVEHHLGELFPRVGFIVTTLIGTNRAVVKTGGRLIRHVLHSATRRKLLDRTTLSADPRPHRSTCVAPDVIERTVQAENRIDAGASVATEGGQLSEERDQRCWQRDNEPSHPLRVGSVAMRVLRRLLAVWNEEEDGSKSQIPA